MNEVRLGEAVIVEGHKYISFALCLYLPKPYKHPEGLCITHIPKQDPWTDFPIDFGWIPSMFLQRVNTDSTNTQRAWHRRCRPISLDQFRMLISQYSTSKDIHMKTTHLYQEELTKLHQFFNP